MLLARLNGFELAHVRVAAAVHCLPSLSHGFPTGLHGSETTYKPQVV